MYFVGQRSKVNSFKIIAELHSFSGRDGYYPRGELIRDFAGNLYGTTAFGGAFDAGTVFKVNIFGHLTLLHIFGVREEGFYPSAGLIQDAEGNLFGTTSSGYAPVAGVVFKLDTTLKITILHTFTGGADGGSPHGLVQDAAGNLYGSTTQGGALWCNPPLGCGTVFESYPMMQSANRIAFTNITGKLDSEASMLSSLMSYAVS
jgi:uncharacterized repeat protein (TIGR03803 family)